MLIEMLIETLEMLMEMLEMQKMLEMLEILGILEISDPFIVVLYLHTIRGRPFKTSTARRGGGVCQLSTLVDMRGAGVFEKSMSKI